MWDLWFLNNAGDWEYAGSYDDEQNAKRSANALSDRARVLLRNDSTANCFSHEHSRYSYSFDGGYHLFFLRIGDKFDE